MTTTNGHGLQQIDGAAIVPSSWISPFAAQALAGRPIWAHGRRSCLAGRDPGVLIQFVIAGVPLREIVRRHWPIFVGADNELWLQAWRVFAWHERRRRRAPRAGTRTRQDVAGAAGGPGLASGPPVAPAAGCAPRNGTAARRNGKGGGG
jgi:hypothetical protein